MAIKNVVFDIGNVLLKWKPREIIDKNFPKERNLNLLANKILESSIWTELNLGNVTEKEAIKLYNKNLNISIEQLTHLIEEAKHALIPIEGSLELLNKLYDLAIPLYCITDNVKEIMAFLKQRYDFFKKFKDIIVSAELGILKPAEAIYLHLIRKHNLISSETVFIDDLQKNVEGAKAVGMYGIHFTTASDCSAKLSHLGINL